MFEQMTKKDEYLSPQIEITKLQITDVIVTSNQGGSDGDGWGTNLDNQGWT